MFYSQMLITTKRERPVGTKAPSHYLSLMGGFITPVASGLYSFSPLGNIVVNRIESIIRKHMDRMGALEVSLPILQPSELWKQTGRWDIYGEEMLKVTNRDKQEFCLAPTHEEIVTQLVKDLLQSYRQLPVTVYQIGRKFRDEKRPRHGLLRTREFIMKDAYNFSPDEEGLEKTYQIMQNTYKEIFKEIGVKFTPIQAKPGEMGGSRSVEFLGFSEYGEDSFLICNNCGYSIKADEPEKVDNKCNNCSSEMSEHTGIEIGHVFKLGKRYTEPMDLSYRAKDGSKKFVEMGCCGIGISRIISPIIEQNHDEKGIIWPLSVAPFEISIIPLNYADIPQQDAARIVHQQLTSIGKRVILDDRDVSTGVKFRDSELIGIPYKLIISPRNLQERKIEVESRKNKSKNFISLDSLIENLDNTINSLQ